MSMARIIALQEVAHVEANGEALWRLDGSPDGRQSRYIDGELRDALTDALTRVSELEDEGTCEKIANEIANAQKACAELMTLGLGESIDVKAGPASTEDNPVKWIENAADLIESLGERCATLVGAEPGEPRRARAKVVPIRRSKLGATTMTLPLLMAPIEAANDVAPATAPKRRGRKPGSKNKVKAAS